MNFVRKKIKNILVKLDRIISSLYFKEHNHAVKLFHQEQTPFINSTTNGYPNKVIASFLFFNQIPQTEYAYELNGKNYIEPHSGWILDSTKRKCFKFSFPYKELSKAPSFFKINCKSYKIVEYEKVISIRYYFFNYWHFINDVLGQIALISNFESDLNIPILVPQGALSIPYVKSIIDSSKSLSSRKWIELSEDTMILASKIIVAKNLPNTRDNILRAYDLMECENFPSPTQLDRKIFMTRANHLKRSISNYVEIENLMKQLGYEIIDNSVLSFSEQVKIYREASIVVGIHGAGLTNLIFRYPLRLKFIEIFPADLIPPHYYWLCNQLGFDYDCILGASMVDERFYLDPESVIKKLYS